MLAYDVRGRGSLLVLIQGVGVAAGVGSVWSTAGPPVSGQHHRQPRHRRLRRPAGHYSARVMAQDVLAVLTTPASSVVGTSLGGMIAQELTLAHAEWVDKLVLVATIPGWTAQPPYAAPHHLPARPFGVHG
jgi:pimeloyl-ACP methyl ester carboxylesterase